MKRIRVMLAFFVLVTSLSVPNVLVDGMGHASWQGCETKSIYIAEGVNFEGNFNIGNETKTILDTGEEVYSKKANIRGEFIKSPNAEVVLSSNLEVTFKYDKKRAWIENPQMDIVKSNYSVNNPKWKITSNQDVYVSPGQCIVSEKSELYKKASWYNIRKSWGSVGNFHADMVCSVDGEISFNVESLDRMDPKEFILKTVSCDNQIMEGEISRQTRVIDKKYISENKTETNKEDRYDYVTRRIEISYTNSKGKTIAESIIDVNFRYNPITNEVECISTSHKENVPNAKNDLDVYMRSGDKTRNYGGAYGKIQLGYSHKLASGTIEEILVVECDFNGTITSEIRNI